MPSKHIRANSWLPHTYDAMVWLSRTTDDSNFFIRSREVRANESWLYLAHKKSVMNGWMDKQTDKQPKNNMHNKTKPPTSAAEWRAMIRQICNVRLQLETLSQPGPMSYLHGLALRIWTSFWRREGSIGMDMNNGAVKRAFHIQVEGKRGPGRPKMTWKQLTERDCRKF